MAQRGFLTDNALEDKERGPGSSLAWSPLCDRRGTVVFRRLVEAAPESEGGGFFFILTEPLGLSGCVQLLEGKFLAGRGP